MAEVSISAIPAFALARCSTACAGSNDHQQGGRTGPFPRGRRVHPRQSNWPLTSSRAARRDVFRFLGAFRHLRENADLSRLSPFIPSALACRPSALGIRAACRPSVRNPLAHKQVIQAVAYGPHRHHQVLSSAVSVGIDPNENGLTHATQRLPSRGKTND